MSASLATVAQFQLTPLNDLTTDLAAGQLAEYLAEATSLIESFCDRRFAPFTLTETHRLNDADPDDTGELIGPLGMYQQIAQDYGLARGAAGLARHFWVREYPTRYPELWSTTITALNVYWPQSITPNPVPVGSVVFEQDTGHGRFELGTFVPQGSTLSVTYTAGYQTIPPALVRACIRWAASLLLDDLNPERDSGALLEQAQDMLLDWVR